MTARITMLPAAAAERERQRRDIARNLGLSRSGYEVFAALIAELGNGPAPDWLDRFAQEEFGGTWDEVSAAFAQVVARGEARPR
jgi:hypothetical protein